MGKEMKKTFVEKVLNGKQGEIVEVSPDFILSHDNTRAIRDKFLKLGIDRIKDNKKPVIVLDHTIPAANEKYASNHKIIREFVNEQGIEYFYDINSKGGICHQVLSEKGFALPGAIILGADSHTTTYGAFGAFSAGIGRSEVAALWAMDSIWLRVPESIKIVIHGKPRPYISAKDIVLYIIGKIKADGALYKSIEFSGNVVEEMSIASRMVLTNMAAEMGAKNAYIMPDKKTLDYVDSIHKKAFIPVYPDEGCDYERVLEFDVSEIEPQVAFPHNVDNVRSIEDAEGIEVNQVLLGTCTNGRLEDLSRAAQVISGRRVSEHVRFLVIPASWEIYRQALKQGILSTLIDAGAVILNSGCGPCLGAHMGILAKGEKVASTSNRNFKGRMGSTEAEIYLVSPETAAATAIEGKIANPRKYL